MYGLIGKKLTHSYSKEIHELLQSDKYSLIELNELASFFQEKKFKGINVTIPYKQAVIEYCDTLSEIAIRTHSVNSIINNGKEIKGYNTDYVGLSFALDYHQVSLKNKTILILGNGSTSRTIQILCADRKAREIIVSARNPQHNEIHFNDLKNHQNVDVIFNATPVGMYPEVNNSLNLDLSTFPNLKVVVDLIYNPFKTKLLLSTKKRNLKTINGLLMLVHQAVKSSELFHNTIYPEEITLKIYRSLKLKMLNFVLIGMPMSGKSYFAQLLGEHYHKIVVDIDKLIEETTGQSIPSIFRNSGENAFRNLETNTIMSVAKEHNQAISIGGGAILNENNIQYLKQNGIIVFLDVSLAMLKTFNPKNRPLLKDKNNLEKLYYERYPLYTKYADITITKDSLDENKTLHTVEVKIDEYLNS